MHIENKLKGPPPIGFKNLIFATLAIILSIAYLHPPPAWGQPMSATANLNYRITETEEDSTWDFTQSYNLSYLQEITAALNFDGNIRYNYNMSNEGDDGSQLNPNLNLTLRNDLFSASLGTTLRRLDYDEQALRESWSWDASCFSQWDEKWPSLRLNYNESYSRDDANPRQQDDKSTQTGIGINYEWRFLEFSYDYRLTNSYDYVDNNSFVSNYHHATLQLSKSWSFWQDRATIGMDQRLTYDHNKSENNVGAGNEFLTIARRLTGSYAIDNTPTEGELSENRALTDRNYLVSAGIQIAVPINYHNIGFLAEDRSVNRIKVYFDRELKASETQKLNWQIYISEDGLEWTKTSDLALVSYEFDPVNVQTVAVINNGYLINSYGKIVVRTTENLFEPIYITEIEVGEVQIAETDQVKTTRENWLSESSLNFSLAPLDNWTLSANFDYLEDHRQESDRPDDTRTEINGSLTSDYYLNRYFWLTLGANENRKKDETDGFSEDDKEDLSRSYTAALKSTPLETLDISLVYTHGENFEDGDKTSTYDNLNFSLAAQIYPDVSADFSTFWNKSDEETDFTWRFDATARLTRKINLDLYCDNLDRYGLNLNWRPSDIFSLTSLIDRDDEAETNTLGSTLAWVCTKTLRSSVNYYLTDSPESLDQRISFNCNWTPCPLINLSSDLNYLDSQANGNTLNCSLRLNLRY